MSRVVLTVCDVCEDMSKEVRSYRITVSTDSVNVDLCADHAEVLDAFFAKSKTASASPRSSQKSTNQPRQVKPRAARASGMQVTSLDQIEKLKQ